jgi:STE24 endopeptidase
MNETKARRYQRFRRRGRAAGLAAAGAVVAVLALTPAGPALVSRIETISPGQSPLAHASWSLAIWVAVILLLVEAAALPAALYVGLSVDARRGVPRPPVAELLGIQARLGLTLLPAAIFAGLVVEATMRVAGGWWWMPASLLLTAGLAGALHGMPAIVAAFARSRPLGSPELGRRLSALSVRAGVPIARIEEIPVDENDDATAFVCGLGRSRRVFVASTLVRDWTPDEVGVVVAHEIGHLVRRDLWRTLALDGALLTLALLAAQAVLAFGLPASRLPGTLEALPLVALVGGAVWLATAPIRHAQSRHHERRADLFALGVTGQADAFAAVIRRLGARHLSEDRPSRLTRWLSHRHPSVAERLALAEGYRDVVAELQRGSTISVP